MAVRLFLALLFSLISVSCVTIFFESYSPISIEKPIYLRLGAQQGRTEVVRYTSAAHIRTYNKKGFEKLEKEHVNFDAESETVLVDVGLARIYTLITSKNKKGNINLNDLAFPADGKSLAFTFYPNGEVLNVQGFSKESIFYVPSISLPLKKVSAGDTWNMKRSWIGSKSGITFTLSLVSILKSFYSCGKLGRCADIEISGEVNIEDVDQNKMDFKSEIKGRFLFSVDKGTVIWSSVNSFDSLKAKDSEFKVETCLESLLIAPEKMNISIPTSCSVTRKGLSPLPGSFH